MSNSLTTKTISMLEMLPDEDIDLVYKMVERLVKTWDPDYTKLTSDEANELRQIMSEMDNGEFVTDDDMDW